MADDEPIISGLAGDDDFDEEFVDEGDSDDGGGDDVPALRRLYSAHPECLPDYVESVMRRVGLSAGPPITQSAAAAAEIVLSGSKEPIIGLDESHKSYPFLTKYESTRIIGFRANQLSQGAQPFVPVPDHVSDVREIARIELAAKRLPFIIKRPMPDGTYEYWRLQDLLQL